MFDWVLKNPLKKFLRPVPWHETGLFGIWANCILDPYSSQALIIHRTASETRTLYNLFQLSINSTNSNIIVAWLVQLTHFSPVSHFYTP